MNKTFLIMRQELSTTFSRRAYLVFAFGVPLLAVLTAVGARYFQDRSGRSGPDTASNASQSPYNLAVEGYVDQSGVILSMPNNFPADRLIGYPNEEQAKDALMTGRVEAYYVIPSDYVDSGKIFYVYPDTKSYLADGQEWAIQWALTTNLLQGDIKTADWLWNPVWFIDETSLAKTSQGNSSVGNDCSQPGSACRSNKLVRLIPSVMVILLFFALLVSSSMLFSSIGAEKENRTLEVLLLSINTRHLLGGKTLALGIAGLVQVSAWLVAAVLVFNLGGTVLNLPEGFHFPAGILAGCLVFFIGGYLLYASLMAGAGALVPKMKETGVANVIVMAPLCIGYMIGLYAPLGRATEASLPVVMSLVPFTAPVVMVMRLADSTVPTWQILFAAGLTFMTAYVALRSAAATFHAQNLLSGQPFSISRYLKAMAGRG